MNDILIIGAGIVGLATALGVKRKNPALKVLILEKEGGIAKHQSSHNSGVIHSGLYYPPGSLKATNCIQGYTQLIEFCQQYGIEYEICGKLVVATNDEEIPYLNKLQERGELNGLKGIKRLKPEEIKEYEPHIAGTEGIFVPQTGIVDYGQVASKYAEIIQEQDGRFELNQKVIGIHQSNGIIAVETEKASFHTKVLVNCAGLYSDKIAAMVLNELDLRIIPFRGEYFKLKKERESLINNLVYPVPNPNFPFLGVHFTRMIGGGVEAGPNAVLAFKKEGYSKSDIQLAELLGSLTWPGFRKVAQKYWSTGMGEMYRSFSKKAFAKALQKLLPEISTDDLEPGGSGVRAQACMRDGRLVDDFLILNDHKVLNVCNAPSPAATSSLSIGNTIADRALKLI